MSHCYFQHSNTFYKQKFCLPISSQLSSVLACIYLEFLESDPFEYIILSNSSYFRHIDNILLIYPQELYSKRIIDRLNDIEPSIKLT